MTWIWVEGIGYVHKPEIEREEETGGENKPEQHDCALPGKRNVDLLLSITKWFIVALLILIDAFVLFFFAKILF